jgi:hypothetical protein
VKEFKILPENLSIENLPELCNRNIYVINVILTIKAGDSKYLY